MIAAARRGAMVGIAARIINAGVLLLTQIIFARQLGADGFGIYALATTWIVALTTMASLGLTMTPQRFQPDYLARNELGLLWGLMQSAHVVPFFGGVLLALCVIAALALFGSGVDPTMKLALMIGVIALPALAMIDVVEGFALANEWNDLGYGFTYVARPLLLLGLAGLAFSIGTNTTALAVMAAFVAAAWVAALALVVLVYRRFSQKFKRSGARYEWRRWASIAAPCLGAELALLGGGVADVMILALFAPSAEVGVYVAATKIVGIVAFVQFGLAYASAHHFAGLRVGGTGDDLRRFAIQTARWTFWPALVVAIGIGAAGGQLLGLFGEGFSTGFVSMPLLLGALLVRASLGPSEQLLMMTDRANALTAIHGAATFLAIGLALVLVPPLGMVGAATATAISSIAASLAIALVVRRTIGGFVNAFCTLPCRRRGEGAP